MTHTPALELDGLAESDALATLTPADAVRFRIVVTPDADAESPADWGQVTIVSLTSGNYGNTPTGGSDPLDLQAARDRMAGDDWRAAGILRTGRGAFSRSPEAAHDERVTAAAIRWARVFHGVHVAEWRPSGPSQSDWGHGLVYLEEAAERAATLEDQARYVSGMIDTLDTWYRGDVSTVSLQRNAADDLWDDDAADWVEVGDLPALGGCYLEQSSQRDPDAYTPAACVSDHWGVPRAFADAVDVVEQYSY